MDPILLGSFPKPSSFSVGGNFGRRKEKKRRIVTMEVTKLWSAATPLSAIRNIHNKYNYPSFTFTTTLLNHRNHSSVSFPPFNPLHFSQFNINHRFNILSAQKGQLHVLQTSGVDELYDALVSRVLHPPSISSNPNFKHLVGLAGPPGAGKSTLANEVARRINKIWLEKASSMGSQFKPLDVAVVIPMDGFHLYRSELDALENPEEAHARRGAPWTLNPSRILTCLKNLQTRASVYVPSFDNGVGDPVEEEAHNYFCRRKLSALGRWDVEGDIIFV